MYVFRTDKFIYGIDQMEFRTDKMELPPWLAYTPQHENGQWTSCIAALSNKLFMARFLIRSVYICRHQWPLKEIRKGSCRAKWGTCTWGCSQKIVFWAFYDNPRVILVINNTRGDKTWFLQVNVLKTSLTHSPSQKNNLALKNQKTLNTLFVMMLIAK